MSNEETQHRQSLNPGQFSYTDVEALSRFVTDTGKILPRRITGLTARHQRAITKSIKRARSLLIMK